jgi:hypothetical protein
VNDSVRFEQKAQCWKTELCLGEFSSSHLRHIFIGKFGKLWEMFSKDEKKECEALLDLTTLHEHSTEKMLG